jgi:peptidoglycan-associated lipoprotein
MRGDMRNRRVILTCAALAWLAALLSGCAGSGSGGSSASFETTNAPVQAAIDVRPGSEEDFIVNVGRRTFFKQGSAAIDETARMTLEKQAQWLQQNPHWKVKLQGFADDPGSPTQQTALSQRRAEAVRDYLASRGIAADRMKAKGYGRDRLVGDCADIECKAQNRRVVTNPQEDPDF